MTPPDRDPQARAAELSETLREALDFILGGSAMPAREYDAFLARMRAAERRLDQQRRAALPATAAGTCEGGVTVRWCPRCGTCTCPDQQSSPDGWIENPTCAIHGSRSDHAEPVPAPAAGGAVDANMAQAKTVLGQWNHQDCNVGSDYDDCRRTIVDLCALFGIAQPPVPIDNVLKLSPHGPVSEHTMKHFYGASGYVGPTALASRLSPPQAVETDRRYVELAVALGYGEYPEGQGSAQVAEPTTIIGAWKALEQERDTALARVPPPRVEPVASVDLDLAATSSAFWRLSEASTGDYAKYLRSASRCVDKAALQRARETEQP